MIVFSGSFHKSVSVPLPVHRRWPCRRRLIQSIRLLKCAASRDLHSRGESESDCATALLAVHALRVPAIGGWRNRRRFYSYYRRRQGGDSLSSPSKFLANYVIRQLGFSGYGGRYFASRPKCKVSSRCCRYRGRTHARSQASLAHANASL